MSIIKAVERTKARREFRREQRQFRSALDSVGTDAARRELQTIWAARH
jgi:hypothetical protein